MKNIFPCWHDGIKSYDKGGRVQCDVCKSFSGVYSKQYLRKDDNGKLYPKRFSRCASCGSLQVTNNWTGEMLLQKLVCVLKEN